MLIDQGSQNAIINWDSFSIGTGAGVTFNNGIGATLNRVQGAGTSYIDGSLNATGSLFLINQNGVVIGKDGVIQTGGKFVASTLDISDADFLDGGDMTFSGDSSASVINLGKVGSLGGDIALIARHVTNEGELTAPNGTVGLAAGREVLMRDASLNDGMFVVKIGDADSSVTEAGLISAATAELRANGGNIYALAGNNGGAINATGVSTSGGRIFLTAGGGNVRVAKKVRATRQVSGRRSGGEIFVNADVVNIAGLMQADGETGLGGRIDIGGREIALEGATVDASGATGGGQIRVGGGYRGGDFGSLTTATRTSVDSGSVLNAGATQDGNGGQVIVWANGTTLFDGQIDIGGGAAGGNGGLAETSGAERLWVGSNTYVYGAAPNGRAGSWLLDPKTITVATGGTATLTDAADDTDSTNDITIDPSTINSATVDVTLWASDKITVDNAISNASAITLSFISDEFDINAGVSVPNGTIMFDTAATSTLSVGLSPAASTAGADIQTDELALLSATNLIFGNPDTAQNSVANLLLTSFPANANITGLVQYNSLGSTSAFILAKGDQTYASVEFNARDGIEFGASQTLTTTVGDIVLNADVDNTGPVGGFDDLRADTGSTVTINSKADILVTAPRITESGTGKINFSANSGAGTLTFERSFAGTIGIGDGAGGDMAISDDQLSRMSAASLTFGDTTYTTAIDVDGGDYSGLGAWTLKTTATGGVQLADATENYSFGSLTSNTGTTTVGANITTSGAQTYNSAVTLTGDSAFASTGGDIKFGSTINGAFGLTANTPGVTTFGGAIGGTTALTSLITDAFGTTTISTGSIKVDGNTINFNDAVTLTKDLTITETGDVTFAKTVDSDAVFTPRVLTINSGGEVTFGGGVGGIAQLFSLGATGSAINMNGGGVNAILQTYTGDVVLGADAVLSGGLITFNDDVYGPHNLEITSSGLVTFDGHVGKEGAADILTSLTVNGKTQINGKDVYTTGDQSYNGTLHITGGTKLYSDTDLNAGNGYSNGNISFTGNVTAEDNNLSIFTDGDITFAGNIGGSDSFTRVKNLETSGSGKTHLNGSTVEVQKEANFNNGVVIGSGVKVTSSSDDPISFNGTVDGPGGLEIDTGGYVQILKRIGGTTPLASLVVSDGASSLILGKDVTTASGGQDYKRVVFVAADVDFTDTGNGEIRFRNSLNSAIPGKFDANIQTGGDVRFDDKVGRIIALGDLDVTAGGTIFANGGLVRTQGSQTYNGVVSVQGTVFAATAGSLTFGSGITTTLPDNSLWLLATDDIKIGGDIQWDGTGDVTLVAGWDGSTGWTSPATTADTAAIVNAGAYGGGTGDISIGTSTQTTGISVGSRDGTTTALGQNMYLVSSTSDDGFAQLGFRGAATGDIDVMLTEDLTTLTAAGLRSFVQIGHGGYDDDNDHSGDISINVGETVFFSGGGGTDTYAQIGHGGTNAEGTNSSVITIDATGSISFGGGSGLRSYAQIGNGGYRDTGGLDLDASGNISITSGGDIGLTAGSGIRSYAQFGHGGYNNDGDHSGAIAVTATGQLTVNGGSASRSAAQIGHGGLFSDRSQIGSITVEADEIELNGGSSAYTFAHIGHGGSGADGLHSGAIAISASGDVDLFGGTDDGAFAQIGHGGWDSFGNSNGALDLAVGGNLTLTGGDVAAAFAMVGHGDAAGVAGGTRMGDISIVADGMTTLLDGAGGNARAWLGHYTTGSLSDADFTLISGGLDFSGTDGFAPMVLSSIDGGDVTVVNTLAQNNTDDYDKIVYDFTGPGFLSTFAETSNNLTFVSSGGIDFRFGFQATSSAQSPDSGDITLISGWDGITGLNKSAATIDAAAIETADAFGASIIADQGDVNIGDRTQTRDIAVGTQTGDVTVLAHDLEVRGGDNGSYYAQLGARPYWSGVDVDSDIRIVAKDDVFVEGGDQGSAWAQIGHGGVESAENLGGDISITAGDEIYVAGGDGDGSSAHIGHGVSGTYGGTKSGNITLTSAYLGLFGGDGDYSFAQIGHGGYDVDGPAIGDITANVMYDTGLFGGEGDGAYAQLGHMIDAFSPIQTSGNISIRSEDIFVVGGSGEETYAQVGHFSEGGTISGSVTVAGLNLEVSGGLENGAEAQIGHFGYGGIDGDIAVTITEDVTLTGGDDDYTAAYIGHSGEGDVMAAINVSAGGNLALLGGTGEDSEAQIGHSASGGTLSGNVTVDAGGFVALVGGFEENSYAQIGHGYFAEDFTAIGDISVTSGESIFVTGGFANAGTRAQIGHGGDFARGSLSGAIDVVAADNMLVFGGAGDFSAAQIGHGGYLHRGTRSGDISVTSNGGGSVPGIGGVGVLSFGGTASEARIGHGGTVSQGNSTGDITVAANGPSGSAQIFLAGGADMANLAQIGHGGLASAGTLSGDIEITATGDLVMLGGSGSDSYAMIGHGANTETGSTGDRTGDISVVIGGEASLEDGTGDGQEAWIGHRTVSGTVSGSNVYLEAFGFDRDSGSTVAAGDLGSFNKDILLSDIPAGDFTLIATRTGLLLEDPVYNSPFQLLVSVNNDLVLGSGATFTNTGAGNIILAAGDDFHNDTGSLTPIVTGGRWLIYSTRPDSNRNDIEISNWDFLRYATTFDINDPVPSAFASGNGLIYSVTPVVNISASDETIFFGETPAPTVTQSLAVNGVAVNPADFGLMFDTSSPDFGYGPNVLFDIHGHPLVGNYPAGLQPNGLLTTYYGVVVNSDPGDLAVLSTSMSVPGVTYTMPTGSRVAFGLCSPSEDDLSRKAYDQNTGQICTLLPTEEF